MQSSEFPSTISSTRTECIDLSDYCRLCLQLPGECDLLDLQLIYDEDEHLSYYDCFTKCTQIDLRGGGTYAPHQLCKSCGLELQVAYDFHKKVEESKKFLVQFEKSASSVNIQTTATTTPLEEESANHKPAEGEVEEASEETEYETKVFPPEVLQITKQEVDDASQLDTSMEYEELEEHVDILDEYQSVDELVEANATKDAVREKKDQMTNLQYEFHKFKEEIKQQIKADYAKINQSLDKIFRSPSGHHHVFKLPEINPKDNFLQNFKLPLSSCKEVTQFESKIRTDEEFRTQLVDFLSKIGGRAGCEDGAKIAYKIVDCVFKSEVLIHYSWTGVSRGKSGEKRAFQMLEGILGVFFDVISLADSRHTLQKNCAIFKDGVLKHAKKRTERKRIRLPGDVSTPTPPRLNINASLFDSISDRIVNIRNDTESPE